MVLIGKLTRTLLKRIQLTKRSPLFTCEINRCKHVTVSAFPKVGVSNWCKYPTTFALFAKRKSQVVNIRVWAMSSISSSDPTEGFAQETEGNNEGIVSDDPELEDISPSKKTKIKKKNESLKISSVGRIVPDRIVHLIDENGDNLGPVHRVNAIKLSEERNLKLVLVGQNAKPHPVYKLMTGKELHENQLKLREKQKSKAKPITTKEVKISGNISENDLNIKKKHIHGWIDKGHHIKIVINDNRRMSTTFQFKEELIQKLMEGIQGMATLNSKPKSIGSEGKDLQCVLRLMSLKEKAAARKAKKERQDKTN